MDRGKASHEPVQNFTCAAQHREVVTERNFPEPLAGLVQKLKPRPQQQDFRVADQLIVENSQLRVRGQQQDRIFEAICLPLWAGQLPPRERHWGASAPTVL